ncbi:MAG: SMC family ATPase [Methanobacteriota archaeon]|nr:MAG: SMC family ATPase [Euryarchaeota archaeon]
MRISYLELRNYRRFRSLKLEFPDGIIGILGLNGAGKSTVIEGIAWALFGNEQEIVRTSRDGIRRSGAGAGDSVAAVLEFEMEGVEYRVEREMGGRSLSMKAVLRTRDGVKADGDRAVRAAVQGLLGMDYKSFFTSVFARQKELNELQDFPASERKKVVLRMLRIDGIDSAIKLVREDRKSASQQIQAVEAMLLDSEGNDRENAVATILDSHSKSLELAERALAEAVKDKDRRIQELEKARGKRNSLARHFEAHRTAEADLKATRRTVADMRARESRTVSRIKEIEELLKKLPELERADRDWLEVRRKKEALEEEKARFDRKSMLVKDAATIERELRELAGRANSIAKDASDAKEVRTRIESIAVRKRDVEDERAGLSAKLADMRARMDERRSKLEGERDRLEEITHAGREGLCPTCERVLEEAYDPLVAKLGRGLHEAESAAAADAKGIDAVQADLEASHRKLEALDRKLRHSEGLLAKATKAEAAIGALNDEIARAKARLEEKTSAADAIGELHFSPEQYRRIKDSHDKLAQEHEELVRLREKQGQLSGMRRDLEELRESLETKASGERTLAALVSELEPKRRGYEGALKEFDDKTDEANAAAEALADARIKRDRVSAEIESSRRELGEIRRQKERIKSQRDSLEELSLLEGLFVDFKDHLIGRIAPTLSEITSEMMDMMTDGKYDRAELDDDYQISIDEDGTLHPLNRFSGGEADIANLSFRLAISRMIADRTGTNQVNLLVLDEVFGSLDPTRKRSVMMALSALAAQFRQVMLITHVDDMKDLMAHIIKVEELPDGTSSAKVVS